MNVFISNSYVKRQKQSLRKVRNSRKRRRRSNSSTSNRRRRPNPKWITKMVQQRQRWLPQKVINLTQYFIILSASSFLLCFVDGNFLYGKILIKILTYASKASKSIFTYIRHDFKVVYICICILCSTER